MRTCAGCKATEYAKERDFQRCGRCKVALLNTYWPRVLDWGTLTVQILDSRVCMLEEHLSGLLNPFSGAGVDVIGRDTAESCQHCNCLYME